MEGTEVDTPLSNTEFKIGDTVCIVSLRPQYDGVIGTVAKIEDIRYLLSREPWYYLPEDTPGRCFTGDCLKKVESMNELVTLTMDLKELTI